MTPCHETGQLTTFAKREDNTLPADNPMTAPTAYATLSPAVPALALLSAWLAARAWSCASSAHPCRAGRFRFRARPARREQDVRYGHHKSVGAP